MSIRLEARRGGTGGPSTSSQIKSRHPTVLCKDLRVAKNWDGVRDLGRGQGPGVGSGTWGGVRDLGRGQGPGEGSGTWGGVRVLGWDQGPGVGPGTWGGVRVLGWDQAPCIEYRSHFTGMNICISEEVSQNNGYILCPRSLVPLRSLIEGLRESKMLQEMTQG